MPDNTRWSIIAFFKGVAGYLFCRKIPALEKLLVVGIAIAYLLIPLDVIPDIFLPFGFLDDFGIGTLIMAYMSYRLNRIRRAEELATPERVFTKD